MLALVFLAVLLVPVLVDLSSTQEAAVTTVNFSIWGAFAVDYVVRLYLAPARWLFVRTHPLDLLVIALPMLRPLRALRVAGLFRLGTVLGVIHARANRSLHFRVGTYVITAVIVILGVAAVAMRDAERGAEDANIESLSDALWWAATTVTTVGYGDRYPTTDLGRLIAVGLMVVGIALLGVITATIAAWFVDRLKDVREAEERTDATLSDVLAELREVRARLEDIERHTADP